MLRPAHKIAGLGWKKDRLDPRDKLVDVRRLGFAPATGIDLRPNCPPPYDQGQLGSCTANATGFCYQYARKKNGIDPDFTPSRLFIYYNERTLEGTVNQDAGAQIRDGLKVIATIGAPPEEDWPYVVDQFAAQPPQWLYDVAKMDRALTYAQVPQGIGAIRAVLASGLPVAFGFLVFPEFESAEVASSGMVPMPDTSEQPLGGHAVAIIGDDPDQQRVLVRNSWGEGWGIGGNFWMPYAYVAHPQLASDFWSIGTVEALPVNA